MHVDADLRPHVQRPPASVGKGRYPVRIDRLAREAAQPACMTRETPATVNAQALAKVLLKLCEARDFIAIAGPDVDEVDIALVEEIIAGLELRVPADHERAPMRGLAAPLPESLAEVTALVVSGRDIEGPIKGPQVRDATDVRR